MEENEKGKKSKKREENSFKHKIIKTQWNRVKLHEINGLTNKIQLKKE